MKAKNIHRRLKQTEKYKKIKRFDVEEKKDNSKIKS